MKRLTYYLCGILLLLVGIMPLSAQSQYKDTIVVARDGSGDYRTLTEAMEGIRAFMDYKVTVLIKNGTYKEKAIIPSWVQNVDFIGESVENTIITYDDHANINKMGTFRTYTVKVQGNNITFKNLTMLPDWGKRLPFIRRGISWYLSTAVCWEIRIPSIQVPHVHAFIS